MMAKVIVCINNNNTYKNNSRLPKTAIEYRIFAFRDIGHVHGPNGIFK